MAVPHPQYAIYLCDNTARRVAFYIIVKIRGVVPRELYLNLQGVPAEFENATCRNDLELVAVGLESVVQVIREMHDTISNNAMGMQSSSVRFFGINPNGVAYIRVLENADAIRAALNDIRIIHHPDPNRLTLADPSEMVGVRFLYTPPVPGGARAAKTQTVAELKALCKKRGLRGYSRMTKAELVKALRRRS